MIRAWLVSFLFTELVEVPIYVVGLRAGVFAALGASALTHPVVWFVFFSPRWEASWTARTIAAELFAWSAEALYFAVLFRLRHAWRWSFLANAASFGTALVTRYFLGAP